MCTNKTKKNQRRTHVYTHTELDGLCSSSKRKKLFHAMSACVQNCFIKIEKLNYRVRVYAIQFRALSYIYLLFDTNDMLVVLPLCSFIIRSWWLVYSRASGMVFEQRLHCSRKMIQYLCNIL